MDEFDKLFQRCVRELTFDFIRAAGPRRAERQQGGHCRAIALRCTRFAGLTRGCQNATDPPVGKRMTNDGVLVIEARRVPDAGSKTEKMPLRVSRRL